MTYASGIALLISIVSLQLSRSPGTGATFWYVSMGIIAFGCLLAIRTLIQRSIDARSWSVFQRRAVQFVLTGLIAAAVISLCGLPPTEELLAVMLLSFSASLWAFSSKHELAMRWAGAVPLVTCLIWLPTIPFYARTSVLVMTTIGAALLLFANAHGSRPDSNKIRGAAACAWCVALACLGVGLVLAAHKWIAPVDLNPSYAGWVPASGGNGDGSENARTGIGGGPDEISTDTADSVGFDQSDSFSESGRDGLYDLWLESYGDPLKNSESQKTVAISPKDARIAHSTDREDLQAGKRFELHRAPTTRPSGGGDKSAQAKLWINGPLPAYVPLATLSRFEGEAWLTDPNGKATIPVQLNAQSGVMEVLNRPISPAFSGTHEYELRVGNLRGDVVPLPPHVEQFRMGKVRQPEFFSSTASGLIRLARRSLPPGVIIHATSKSVSERRLAGVEPALPSHSNTALLDTGGLPQLARELAGEWGMGRNRGWLQIQQVIGRLRESARFVADHRVPAGTDPILDLINGRRGTDYQFATTAAMMLRSLSYPTRVVSGLYAAPEKLDRRSGSVPLDAGSVHFWIEVRLADGTWITIDPTPGFPMLNIPRPAIEIITETFRGISHFLGQHSLIFAAFGVITTAAWLFRRSILDRLLTAYCAIQGYTPMAVLRVLDYRARAVGKNRPPSMPLASWLGALGMNEESAFVVRLNRQLYSSTQSSIEHSNQECRAVLIRCSRAYFKQINEMEVA